MKNFCWIPQPLGVLCQHDQEIVQSHTMLEPTSHSRNWHAQLKLAFKHSRGETIMVDNTHSGPLRVQRTFKVEDQSRHVYILHPPGGYVGGDIIDITVNTEDASHVVATSPGAAKFYRCEAHAPEQLQTLELQAADTSLLEWLPQETILFEAANARLITNIHLSETASFLGWEISCLGRTASGEAFKSGRLNQTLNLYRANILQHRERLHLQPGDLIHDAPWGLNQQPVFGTLLAALTPDNTNNNDMNTAEQRYALSDQLIATVGEIRTLLTKFGDPHCWSATCKEGIILVRYLGPHTEPCKHGFNAVRELLLNTFKQIQPATPRIWAT